MRILIADDNQDGATSTALVLAAFGHTMRVAFNGSLAVKEAVLFKPNVILMDIGMPGLDGYEACRAIRILCAFPVRIIAITGLEGDAAKMRASESGFDHFITKPWDKEKLMQLLRGIQQEVDISECIGETRQRPS